MSGPDLFLVFSDTPDRRAALRGGPGTEAQQYLLYGLHRFEHEGFGVDHNLVGEGPPAALVFRLIRRMNAVLHRCGAFGGDFPTIMRCRRQINRSGLILSTVDSVGFALVLMKKAGLIRPPVVYVSIGLPSRIARIRREKVRRWYRSVFLNVRRFIAYGWEEAELIRKWVSVRDNPPEVIFVPFGVDTDYFRPLPGVTPDADVLSMGRDNQRDFAALMPFARQHPDVTVKIITDRLHAEALGSVPDNVRIVIDAPFSEVRRHLRGARVVALPLKENPYSGATTTLLQAMALARPVVVSRVGAIRNGYGLVDGLNCILVGPGDTKAFGKALQDLLANPGKASRLGVAARAHVESELSWKQYEERMMKTVAAAAL